MCVYVYMCICSYTCFRYPRYLGACIIICIIICVYMHICVYVYMYIYALIHAHVLYMCICIYVYMCMCSYTCLDELCSYTCFRCPRYLSWRRQILFYKGNSIRSQVRTPHPLRSVWEHFHLYMLGYLRCLHMYMYISVYIYMCVYVYTVYMCTCSYTCLDTLCSCTCFRYIGSLGWR